ncbi:MAG: hypothetical protein V8Q16_06985 [Akkermansia muciniphila]
MKTPSSSGRAVPARAIVSRRQPCWWNSVSGVIPQNPSRSVHQA